MNQIEKSPGPARRLEKVDGSALLSLDRKILYAMIDLLFGGKPKESSYTLTKEISRAEVDVAKEIFKLAINQYDQAWMPVYELRPSLRRMEVNVEFIRIVPPLEKTLVTTYSIEFAGISGSMAVTLPYVTIFSARDRLI